MIERCPVRDGLGKCSRSFFWGLSHLWYLALKIVMLDTKIHNKQSGAVDNALGS